MWSSHTGCAYCSADIPTAGDSHHGAATDRSTYCHYSAYGNNRAYSRADTYGRAVAYSRADGRSQANNDWLVPGTQRVVVAV
jgi:hypothetical protein